MKVKRKGQRLAPSGGLAHARSPRTEAAHTLLPIVLVVLLCLPCVPLGFFWDDYYYLTRGQAAPLTYLLPQPGAMSYRPVPEGLYFLVLASLSPLTRNAGHAVNLTLIVASVFLLVRLVSQLSSPRAGIFSGILFSALAPLPTVVAWTSCAPEAFAVFFFLLALNLRHAGRTWGAFAAAAIALFSKETVLLLLPVLVLWDWLQARKPERIGRNFLLYGGLAVLWTGVHPGLRSLLAHGFRSGATGYLGFEQPTRWGGYLVRYLLTVWNVPITGFATRWPEELAPYGAAAVMALLVWFWATRRGRLHRETKGSMTLRRATALALLITIPAMVLPSILVRRWNPYFVCLPALGLALLCGMLLARASAWIGATVLAAYIMMGIWSRGLEIPGGLVLTEQDCVAASRGIQRVERGFRSHYTSFPPGSQALVSVSETGLLGVYGTLIDGQALRIWYGDRTLESRRPERRRAGATADYLFRVTSGLDVEVVEPDPSTWSSAAYEQGMNHRRALRSYARGLAASGEAARAVRIFGQLSESDIGLLRDYDLRLGAMVLLAEGRREEALLLLKTAAAFPRPLALDMIAKLLASPTERASLDSCAFEAFGISRSDPEAILYLKKRTSH